MTRFLSQPIACCIVAVTTLMGASAHADEPVLVVPAFSQSALGAPGAPWQFVGLVRQTKPQTRFRIVEAQGEKVLEIEADRSYGNLVSFGNRALSNNTTLSWRWDLERPNLLANLRTKDGDDAPLKVCVMFDYETAALPFGERAKLSLARSSFSGLVPAATLCYVWDHALPVGTSLINAFTTRIRYIVLQSGEEHVHQWMPESRKVADDFWKTFGPEFRPNAPDDMPPIVGIAVGADADNTQTQSSGFVGDVHLER